MAISNFESYQYKNRLWSRVFFTELVFISIVAFFTFMVNWGVFWVIMLSYGFENPNTGFCKRYRFISDNIAKNRAATSIMVFSAVPTWLILANIASFRDPFVNRGTMNMLAVLSYIGILCVALYNQNGSTDKPSAENERQATLHITGAILMGLTYVIAQIAISRKLAIGNTVNIFFTWFSLVMACINALLLCVYGCLYKYGNCTSSAVIVEYIVFLSTSLTNFIVYINFTSKHTALKIELDHSEGTQKQSYAIERLLNK